jgi:glycine cleavage system aminomethyltransferase T
MTNTMPKTGRIVLTPMLNEFGKLIGDFTIAKVAKSDFMVWGIVQRRSVYHMRWFEKHLPEDGSVRVHRFGMNLVRACRSPGRSARKVLEKLTDDDVSNAAFRFMDFREMDVGGAPCMVNRITYTGDLGYEIWMEAGYQRGLPRHQGGGRGIRHRRFRHAGAAVDAAGEELPDLVPRTAADLRALRSRRWTASSSCRRTISSAASRRRKNTPTGRN